MLSLFGEPIEGFVGEFSFLANESLSPVVFEGIVFPSVFVALCAASIDAPWRPVVAECIFPLSARRVAADFGGGVSHDLDVLKGLLVSKFSDSVLASLLVATGERELVCTIDNFFGRKSSFGFNHLGVFLMEIRSDIC